MLVETYDEAGGLTERSFCEWFPMSMNLSVGRRVIGSIINERFVLNPKELIFTSGVT